MAKCFRCGGQLTRPKCDCGYDIADGIRLLSRWEGDLSCLRTKTPEELRAEEKERKARRQAARNRKLDRIRNILLIVSGAILLAGVISLIAAPGVVLWQVLFGCAMVLSIGSLAVIHLIKVEGDTQQANLLLAVVLILTVLNLILLLVLPGWYDLIGCVCSLMLSAFYLYLLFDDIRSWGLEAFEARSGGMIFVLGIFLNVLLAGHAFGMNISWVLFFILLVVFGIFAAISEFGDALDDHLLRNCVVSGVMVLLCVAYLCGCVFTPHFIHSLRQLPEPGDHAQLSDKTAHAQCVCGEEIQINEFLSDCLHTYMHFDWFVGTTYNMDYLTPEHLGYCEEYHWVICTCGEKFNLGKHIYDDGVCLCGHRQGEAVPIDGAN